MRRVALHGRHVILGVAIVATAFVCWSAITVRPREERELQAAYAGLNAAMKSRNLAAFLAMLTPDYTEQRLTQTEENRSLAEARYRRLFADWISIDRQTTEVCKVERRGNDLVAAVNKLTSGTVNDPRGAYGPAGGTHKLVTDTMDIDRWVNTPRGWKLKRRHIVLARITVDGKELATPAGGHVHEHSHDH